jgi:hypothetical protein
MSWFCTITMSHILLTQVAGSFLVYWLTHACPDVPLTDAPGPRTAQAIDKQRRTARTRTCTEFTVELERARASAAAGETRAVFSVNNQSWITSR